MAKARLLAAGACVWFLFPIAAANAQDELNSFINGNDLHTTCQLSNLVAAQYILGVIDQTFLMQNETVLKICIPKRATAEQVTDTVCLHIEKNPSIRHWPAAAVVQNALHFQFPCPN